MTSTPVNVQGFALGNLYGANRVQTTETKSDFSKIFENQKNVSNDVEEKGYSENDIQDEPQQKETKIQDDVEEINRAEAEEETTTINKADDANQTSEEMNKDGYEDEMEHMAELLSGAVVNVKDLLMQQLQLTEEELNQLMQELNLTDLDLLQIGNVKDLVLQAIGAQDMTALLTDEGLYSQMKSIEAGFADIMQELQTTLEVGEEEIPMITEQVEDYLNAQKSNEEKVITVEVDTDAQTVEEPEVKTVDQGEKNGKEQNPMQGQNAFAEQPMMNGNAENVQATATTQTASYTTVETENIMRQIMEHMRIQLTADATELDMQLQPETLGTLQIKISAKEGVMTAQFTTASESVRGVLESQMVQLQQQFEQQNIKVEAIEVTVQAHAFESALEKGNDSQTSEEETKKNRTRRIDLVHLDGTEELESEEKLLAEMMEANGNTVDYLV